MAAQDARHNAKQGGAVGWPASCGGWDGHDGAMEEEPVAPIGQSGACVHICNSTVQKLRGVIVVRPCPWLDRLVCGRGRLFMAVTFVNDSSGEAWRELSKVEATLKEPYPTDLR